MEHASLCWPLWDYVLQWMYRTLISRFDPAWVTLTWHTHDRRWKPLQRSSILNSVGGILRSSRFNHPWTHELGWLLAWLYCEFFWRRHATFLRQAGYTMGQLRDCSKSWIIQAADFIMGNEGLLNFDYSIAGRCDLDICFNIHGYVLWWSRHYGFRYKRSFGSGPCTFARNCTPAISRSCQRFL